MQPTFIPPVANPQRRSFSSKPLLIVLGISAIIAIIAGITLLIASSKSSPTRDMNVLNAQMQSLNDIIALGSKSASSRDLSKITSDASIIITGDTAAISDAITATGTKADKAITASEKADTTTLLSTLKQAAIDGQFDRPYREALVAKLTAIQTQLSTVNNKSSSRSVKAATLEAYTHFTNILDSLNKLTLN